MVPSEFLPRPDVATAHEALRDQMAKDPRMRKLPRQHRRRRHRRQRLRRVLPRREPRRRPPPRRQTGERGSGVRTWDRFTAAIAETRKLIESGQAAEAEQILFRAVRAAPERRDVRLAFLEAAVLANDFATARAQVPLLEPFGKSESVSKFYAAVALWQSGEPDAARRYAKEARTHIRVNAWVAAWLEKILGGE